MGARCVRDAEARFKSDDFDENTFTFAVYTALSDTAAKHSIPYLPGTSSGVLFVADMITIGIEMNLQSRNFREDTGNVDLFRTTRERLGGDAYDLIPVFTDGALTDIQTKHVEKLNSMTAGTLPEGMERLEERIVVLSRSRHVLLQKGIVTP